MSYVDISNFEVAIVDRTEAAMDFLRWIGNTRTPIMGVDVESSGLDWFDGSLRLVQFGTLTEGWAIPFEMFPHLVSEAMQILEDRRMPLVGHNFKFDMHWLEQNTSWTPTRWPDYHDTLLMASVLDSSGPKGLKDLSARIVHPIAKKGEDALKDAFKRGGWTWATVPPLLQEYWFYGVLDTILTANLAAKLLPRIHDMGCAEAYEVELGCVPSLFAMERHGLLVDRDYCLQHIETLEHKMARIQADALSQWGIEQIGSGPQLVRAFLDAGVKLTTRTDSGKSYSMSKAAFEELVLREGDHPLVDLVNSYRKAEKFKGSYYENFVEYQRSDGRVHPAFRQSQARTGRMSAQYPAIQTLPRPETDSDVRNSFVAPEGHKLVSIDFTNVEARIFAHFAQEAGMLQAIRDGVDLHGYTAQEVYGLWPETGVAPKDHPLRQVSKNTLFCMLFGGGATKVAATAKVSQDEAKSAFDGVHRAFPGIKTFQKGIEQMAKANLEQSGRAWIRGIDGRILMMAENDDRYYAFTNWLIQGTATVLLKQRLRVMHEMGLDPYLVSTIHDEVVAEVPDDEVENVRAAMAEAMLDERTFSVPIVADPGEPAQRLGDAK